MKPLSEKKERMEYAGDYVDDKDIGKEGYDWACYAYPEKDLKEALKEYFLRAFEEGHLIELREEIFGEELLK